MYIIVLLFCMTASKYMYWIIINNKVLTWLNKFVSILKIVLTSVKVKNFASHPGLCLTTTDNSFLSAWVPYGRCLRFTKLLFMVLFMVYGLFIYCFVTVIFNFFKWCLSWGIFTCPHPAIKNPPDGLIDFDITCFSSPFLGWRS